jgi:hypothetical protein|tara:strand:- start:245 stop:436 length:192 start_codon:yes stop_codon:yes gene_type:complete
MLGVDELHLDFRNYLDEIEMYANLEGGSIQSRQIIALAIIHYLDRKSMRKRIEDLEKRLEDKK